MDVVIYMKIFFPNGSFLIGRKYAVMCIHTLFSYRLYLGGFVTDKR